jgi:hypothetical protein
MPCWCKFEDDDIMSLMLEIVGVLAMLLVVLDKAAPWVQSILRVLRKRGYLVLMLCLLPSLADAACTGSSPSWTAADASYTEVQNCVSAASSGDTITVPAGSATWSTQNTNFFNGKALSLIGAGIDVTIITDQVSSDATASSLIQITPNPSGLIRVSGFTFSKVTAPPASTGVISVNPGSVSNLIRVDHNRFDLTNGHGVRPNGCAGGVLDHNTFNLSANSFAIQAQNGWVCTGTGDTYGADHIWAMATPYGTVDNVYVEDNIVNGPVGVSTSTSDCNGWGGHVVLRFNTINETNGIHSHGLGTAGRSRSCRHMEVYGNTFIPTGTTMTSFHAITGGTGLTFYNVGTDTNGCGGPCITQSADLHNYRTDTSYPVWGLCDGTNAWDGNTDSSGYPCMDQPGRGQGDLIGDAASPTPAWPHQALEPWYIWNNLINSTLSAAVSVSAPIVENRDFYNQDNTNCPAGGANCTAGMGVGTLAQRPGSCTSGVGYWATDQGTWKTAIPSQGTWPSGEQGVLYQCVAGSWQIHYTPYVYPHSLVTPEVTPTSSPSPGGRGKRFTHFHAWIPVLEGVLAVPALYLAMKEMIWIWRWRRAVTRWQQQAPSMLTDQRTILITPREITHVADSTRYGQF